MSKNENNIKLNKGAGFTQKDLLSRGVAEIIEEDNLKDRLKSDKSLRVKFGIDPTGPDIHLGHTVNLWKLRHFQDLGHTAVIIIGDYTASIGDPSGKDKTRPPLTDQDIKENYRSYKKQMLKILREDNLEVHLQSEWFKKFTLKDLIKLASHVSVGHLMSHETFRQRLEQNQQFSTHELLYPFLQGYDSVAINADVEIGASEQKFNLLMGRIIQKTFGQDPQDVVITPYLLGTDGKEKMSKSLGNYISVQDEPAEMFGKVMSITDEEITVYFEHATPMPYEEVEKMKKEKPAGIEARNKKIQLAELITTVFWGDKEAQKAKKEFETVFQKQETPQDLEQFEVKNKSTVIDALVETGSASSKNEARRLVDQGGVYINDNRVDEYDQKIPEKSFVLRVGRRRMVKIVPK